MSNMLAINVARFRRFPESRSRGNWDLPRLGLFASQEVGVGTSGSPQNLILRVIPIWTHEVTPNLVPGITPKPETQGHPNSDPWGHSKSFGVTPNPDPSGHPKCGL